MSKSNYQVAAPAEGERKGGAEHNRNAIKSHAKTTSACDPESPGVIMSPYYDEATFESARAVRNRTSLNNSKRCPIFLHSSEDARLSGIWLHEKEPKVQLNKPSDTLSYICKERRGVINHE
jgi:hypothetical protein